MFEIIIASAIGFVNALAYTAAYTADNSYTLLTNQGTSTVDRRMTFNLTDRLQPSQELDHMYMGIPIPQKQERATRDSWKTLPMPEKSVTVPLDLRLSDAQMAIVLYGHIPEAMEDHWFMYCADNRIHYHRSWTGFCLFEASFEESTDGFRVTSLTINQDPEQYRADPMKAKALFCALLLKECGGDAEKYWEQYLSSE